MAQQKFLSGITLNGQQLSNMADGSAATDAVTLQQLQAALAGLSWKSQVRAASTGNGTLASAFANGSSLDGVTLATNDRILLKDQTTAGENGLYKVNASGAPTRVTDADTTAELENAAVFVAQGTVNADKAFVQTATVTTVGTTAQTWVNFGAGGSYSAGASGGLTLSGSAFSILLDTNPGLVLGAGGVKIDTSVVVRKFAADCAATTNPQTFTHNMGTLDIMVMVWEVSSGALVFADITKSSTNAISINFGGAPSAGQYRIVVQA